MKISKLVLSLSFIFISMASHSTTEGKIVWIESETDSNEQALQVRMSDSAVLCGDDSAQYTNSGYLDSNAENFDSVLSMALAAFLSDRTILIDASYSADKGNRCIINKIRII